MQQHKKFFSFIIPIYNAEKHIANCLDSLLNQDIDQAEYEILCINDGSTDASLEILQNYAATYNNIVIINKSNEGVAIARNTGLNLAQGDYIWFIDADDWLTRDCLGTIKLQILKNVPSVVKIQFDWIKAQWRIDECIENVLQKEKVDFFIEDPYIREDIIGVWSFIIKKEIILNNKHKFFDNLHYGEDVLFIRELFDIMRLESSVCESKHRVLYLKNDIFYYYRQHDDSAMHNRWIKNKTKYMDALLKLAHIDLTHMLDTTKPSWYTKQYEELYYDRMYNYMIYWLPSSDFKLLDHLRFLKEEGLYPKKVSREIRKKLIQSNGVISKIKLIYKFYAFQFVWLYPIYYKQMKSKYINAAQTEVQNDL